MYCLDLVVLRIAPIAIHNKRNMLRDWALFQGPYKKLMNARQDPFCRW